MESYGYSNSLAQSAVGYSPQAPPATEAESTSRIRDGVSQSEQLLTAVHEIISMLEKRLDTVLQPVPPQPASNAGQAARTGPVASHLYGRLVILNEGYEHAVARLRDLIRRVDV